jgi:hypothetical protein
VAVGYVGLAARQPPAIAVAAGNGLEPLQVASGIGLGHCNRADRGTVNHARQVAQLLILACVVHEVICDDVRLEGETSGTAK